MSQAIQQMFARIAPTYDQANHALSFNKDILWRKDAVALAAKDGFKPRQALDLCAGTGDFALAAQAQWPGVTVTLADFAKPMLSLAQGKGGASFNYLQADALKLPFQDFSFDALLCGFGVRNLDSAEAGVKEMARVLKPGGKAVILDFFKPTGFLTKLAYGFYVSTILPVRGGAISKDKDAYDYLQKSAKGFLSLDQFKALLEKNGFRDIEVQSYTMGVAATLVAVRK
ncbi:MAG TPA: bifunctional demethylmenaquinone methyltransferase/2-methoxy-6-polyprenyl-1,4-benzoquinol methylase UbiE [bacterium]|nr:bifunctional demethylmenaquinone methyltransferase/2-methoxy-6-polyprenyl-1,4-benzoquinol methylase UbiE [bacterium]